MLPRRFVCAGLVGCAVLLGAAPVTAQETLKIAAGQRGAWDTGVSEMGVRSGIFKKHGIDAQIVYTQGSGETQQAVISGSVDIGISVGTLGAIGAYSKGAPVRVIGAMITGAGDLFWYVKSDSPIKSLADIGGRTIAFSTRGASTDAVVSAFQTQYKVKANPVATGSPAATLTQLMSGQIDVGWAVPPFGFDQIDQKLIRILATGNDADVFKGQSVRLVVANARVLQTRKEAIDKYMKAYRETVDWMYASPNALKTYAEFAGIDEAKAKRVRDGFFPKQALNPDRVTGLDLMVKDAVAMKFTPTELTKAQVDELIQIPPR